MKKTIKVLIVDDSEVVRIGLRNLLAMYPSMEVVGEADCADKAVQLTMENEPDVVLMDIRMPCKSGITACKEILKKSPSTSVIMLTSYDDDKAIYESIMAGASGYVLKEISSQEIISAIELVADGKSLLDPNITSKLFRRLRDMQDHNRINELSEQEKQVLFLIAEGKTNKEIAEKMVLSEKTIRNYVSQILSKLDVSNRAEAAAYAVRYQLGK